MIKEVASRDRRSGGRRHHHRHGAGPGDLPRRRTHGRGRPQPDGDQARHRRGRGSAWWPPSRSSSDARSRTSTEIAQVGTISANGDTTHRQDARRGHGEGRQGRRDHGRRGQGPGDHARTWSRACSSTAATCRPTSSPTRAHAGRARRRPTSWSTRRRSPNMKRPAPRARGRRARSSKPLLDHRRGHRRRSPGHAGGEQAARRAQGVAP